MFTHNKITRKKGKERKREQDDAVFKKVNENFSRMLRVINGPSFLFLM